mmetsp:Transcript_47616/g.103538  ORF Transcript_47616/g.103538 Transcript_47616/m.103538 type:complete len:300 (+) Transcript_47616:993-1892(+)
MALDAGDDDTVNKVSWLTHQRLQDGDRLILNEGQGVVHDNERRVVLLRFVILLPQRVPVELLGLLVRSAGTRPREAVHEHVVKAERRNHHNVGMFTAPVRGSVVAATERRAEPPSKHQSFQGELVEVDFVVQGQRQGSVRLRKRALAERRGRIFRTRDKAGISRANLLSVDVHRAETLLLHEKRPRLHVKAKVLGEEVLNVDDRPHRCPNLVASSLGPDTCSGNLLLDLLLDRIDPGKDRLASLLLLRPVSESLTLGRPRLNDRTKCNQHHEASGQHGRSTRSRCRKVSICPAMTRRLV